MATPPPNMQHWNTRLTRLFRAHGCRVPIMGAPMAGHAGGALAAAVCRAGGLGFIGCGHWLATDNNGIDNENPNDELLRKEVQIFRQQEQEHRKANAPSESILSSPQTHYPLCLGFIGYSTFATEASWDRFRHVLVAYQPVAVQFFAPAIFRHDIHGSNVQLAQRHGAKVLAQVGTLQDAMDAVKAGVDGIIVQGSEAGGHGLRKEYGNSTLPLAATVMAQLVAQGARSSLSGGAAVSLTTPNERQEVLVLAAGGIANGETMAAALALGCDGVVVGTRLCATVESLTRPETQQRLIHASLVCDSIVRTTVFDAIQNTYSDHPWPAPYDSVGALRNQTTRQWLDEVQSPTELATALRGAASTSGSSNSDQDVANIAAATTTTALVSQYRHAQANGNADIAAVLSGEGVGLIHAVEPALDVVTQMSHSAAHIIRALPHSILSDHQEEDVKNGT